MAALPHNTRIMSEAEYLAFERESDTKHQYISGEIFAISGTSRAHNLITANTITGLHTQLMDSPCEVYPADMRVKVDAEGLYTYPDISVVCDEPQFLDDVVDTLLNPTVVIEVLSPSTESYDRGKFQAYRKLPSLCEYVLISQDTPHIEYYRQQTDGQWVLTDLIGYETQVELASIGCTLLLSTVYHKVKFKDNS